MKVFTFFVSFLTFSSCFHGGKTNSTNPVDLNSTETYSNVNSHGISGAEKGYQWVLVSIKVLEFFVLLKPSWPTCEGIFSASMNFQQFFKPQKYQHNVKVIIKNS